MRVERIKKNPVDASTVRVPARAPAWVIPVVKALLVSTDFLIAALAFLSAFYLRSGDAVFQKAGSLHWTRGFAPYGALLLFIVPIRLLTLKYYDLYRLRGEFSFVDDAVRVFKATAIGSLLIVAAAFLYRGGFQFRAFSYARAIFVLDFILALAAYAVLRLIARGAQTFARRRDVNLIPTLVVGRGAEAALCIKEMRERPSLGYRVIGVVENGSLGRDVPDMFEGVPVVSDLKGLPEAIREAGANEVIITDPKVSGDALFDVMMRAGRRAGVEFRIAPSLFNCLPRKTEIDQIGALPMIRLFREPLSNAARITKRAFDLLIASLTLALLSPFWLVVSVLIKLDSKGPVFYKQERVGMDGRLFLFYKFRTMRAGADDASHRDYLKQYIAGDAGTNLGNEEKPVYKLKGDARVTRLGRLLRRLSLDELPQLLNVLRGDMSIVGPRPPIPYEVEAYELWHRKRLDMKPGLTGLWQVSGRNRLPFEEMVRLDLFYIENWSLLLDLKIILRTLPVMLRGDDAY
ncbi:MAG TPA: sugar transferase [Pyrinomonadaceae bacterium]|jgi:exopolysaccharide biosynthesis polyprenyl glycosylphosphotransferase